MKRYKLNQLATLLALLTTFATTSCLDDLNRFPTNDTTSETVYSTFLGYKQVMAKVYGSYSQVGNDLASKDDITMGDGASADFLRCFFNLQSLTTEEAICTWADSGIPDLNYMNWSSSNTFVSGLYYRALYQISLVNEFLRESTEDKVSSRNITGNEAEEIKYFRAEARFLRAFQYWVLMDVYGNPPFVDENTPIGKALPPQISRADLFKYVESELLEIKDLLKTPKNNEYGRADQAACWALLARLYLNAEVYTGKAQYTEAITYASKVISAPYSLKEEYTELFMADNNLNNPETILAINYDGQHNKSYGGLTYIINASFMITRDDVPGINFQEYFGMGGLGGWYGNRSRKELPERFDNKDKRKMFFGSKTSVDNVNEFTDGLAVAKFRNVTSTGETGSNYIEAFTDTDFPLFRLAEMYLIYAEAVLRGGAGGEKSIAIGYFNDLRERAFGNKSANVENITLNDILDERSRELYWECFRRTDLIRYGLYTSGSYVWQWKGGTKNGVGVSDNLNLFPLPATDVMANPNLIQNTGY